MNESNNFVCTVICIYKTFVTSEPLHVPHALDVQPGPMKENHQQFVNDDNELDSRYTELEQTKLKIKELELKIQMLEDRIPKKYPDVTYLNYKNRKRILVRTHSPRNPIVRRKCCFFYLFFCLSDNWRCWFCWIALDRLLDDAGP